MEKGSIGIRLRDMRKEHNMTQVQLAHAAGIAVNSIRLYEGGKYEPSLKALQKIAAALGVSVSSLVIGDDSYSKSSNIPAGFEPLPKMKKVPLIGDIACGTPILAEENIKRDIAIPAKWNADFVLECHGDSMAPQIKDGDLVAIRKQPIVENGEIAAVRIGEEATLKRFYQQNSTVLLQAENPQFAPLVYTSTALNDIVIEGKAVGLCRDL